MKTNPFYGISAAAMLFGCYMLNHALRVEPGHVGKLLLLMGVLQIYETLLLALGAHLVASGRAPRDGLTVLLLETLFLLDATLLATELVTAHAAVGAAVSGMLVALAVAKIAYVRRALPDALPAPVAVLLRAQAAVVFVLPVVVVQVASARLLTSLSFYGLWWLTLALPLAQKVIVDATGPRPSERPAWAAWAWIPAVSMLGHLLALQWIHQVSFHIALVAPFLLGLALAGERQHVVRQIALAAAGGAAGLLGGSFASIADSVAALVRLVARLLPRSVLGWGLAGVVAAFASLALGARRSLRDEGDRPPPARPRRRGVRGPARGAVTTALLLAALASGSMLWALDTYPARHTRQRSAALTCAVLAAAAIWVGALARSRASGPPEDGPGMKAASLAERKGYRRFFYPGQRPDAIPPGASPTSVTTWAYVAVPVDPGSSGIRGFCGDSKGQIFFTPDGSAPSWRPTARVTRRDSAH